MDKLITTNNGGMPFDLDDLRWIEQSILETFKAFGKGLNVNSDTAFRIWGGVATDAGSVYNVAAGAIFAHDEIWLVDAHSIAKLAGAGSYYWKQVITYDVTGSETFENSATVDTYEIRRMELTNTDIDGASSGLDINGLDFLGIDSAFTLKSVFDTLNTQINNATTGIDINLVRSAHIKQLIDVGSSYGSYSDLTGTFSSRGGDPALHNSGNSLGIDFFKNRLYRVEFNAPSYSTDVIRIKNVPAVHEIFSGYASRDGSGNVDIDPSQTRSIFIVNTSTSDTVMTFAVKFDGNLLINVTDMGKY